MKRLVSAYVKKKIKGRKPELARFFDQTGILNVLDLFRGHNLIILNYHRVYKGELRTSFDETLFGTSIDSFHQQMLWLKENRAVFLSEDELIYYQQRKKKIPKRNKGYTKVKLSLYPSSNVINTLRFGIFFFLC